MNSQIISNIFVAEVVVKRLENAVDAERRLDMYLGLVPNFVSNGKAKAKPKAKGDSEKYVHYVLMRPFNHTFQDDSNRPRVHSYAQYSAAT